MPKTKKTNHEMQKNAFHVRGNEFVGKVISAKAPKTVTVEREITVYVSKYERYKKVRSKIHAHNPEWMNAKENDIVQIGETRKISKTKAFVVTKILGHAKAIREREEMKEVIPPKVIEEEDGIEKSTEEKA